MSLTVSVALCTHNGAEFVAEQVLSIVRQSDPPAELVVSDDASSDGTVEIIRRIFVENHVTKTRLVVMENSEPLGVASNFEQAIVACSGDLIALSDQDDVWQPDRLRIAVSRFEASADLLLLNSDARLVDESGEPLGRTLFEALELTCGELSALTSARGFEALLRRNLITGATTMIHRNLVMRAAPFPIPWLHDEWMAIIASATGMTDLVVRELIDYRQHGRNQIGVQKLTPVQKLRRLVEPRGDRPEYLEERAYVLAERLRLLDELVPTSRLRQADEKLAHHRVRAGLPKARWLRVAPVLRELATGRYKLYARGFADALRDVLQPAE